MTMSQHVSTVCRSVNYHIRNIGKIRKYIDYDTCHVSARALVLSRLDYCNSLLNCITQKDPSAFKNSKIMQPVSFTSSQNALIRLHLFMSSIGSWYVKGLQIRLLSSCTQLFLIFRYIIYLSLWI